MRLSYTQHWVLITIIGQWIPPRWFPSERCAPRGRHTVAKRFAQMLLQYYRIAKQRRISPYSKRQIVLNLTGIVKHINEQGHEVFLAGARENRTHSGWLSQPAHGFEDREDHQTPSAPTSETSSYRLWMVAHKASHISSSTEQTVTSLNKATSSLVAPDTFE